MTTEEPGEIPKHSGGIPSTPDVRLYVVRAFAISVFGKELTAASWLGRPHPGILDGACIVATACQTPEGFQQAMAELARLQGSMTDDNTAPFPTIPPPAASQHGPFTR